MFARHGEQLYLRGEQGRPNPPGWRGINLMGKKALLAMASNEGKSSRFQNKQRIKIRFSFLGSLRINTWISDSIVTSKCGIWKLETGISITAKQAASSRASSKSTRTVLLQNSVLAKESEVSES